MEILRWLNGYKNGILSGSIQTENLFRAKIELEYNDLKEKIKSKDSEILTNKSRLNTKTEELSSVCRYLHQTGLTSNQIRDILKEGCAK